MSQITKSVPYNTNATTDDVEISIQIGYGQIASSTIFVKGSPINDSVKGDIRINLGAANLLKGTEVICYTFVYDIQPNTNQTSVKLKVYGGNGVLEVPVKMPASPNSFVTYKLCISFF